MSVKVFPTWSVHVFSEPVLAGLTGDVAIGHTRYSTAGTSVLANAQPIVVLWPSSSFISKWKPKRTWPGA